MMIEISQLFLNPHSFLLQQSHLFNKVLSHHPLALGLVELCDMKITLTRVALLLLSL